MNEAPHLMKQMRLVPLRLSKSLKALVDKFISPGVTTVVIASIMAYAIIDGLIIMARLALSHFQQPVLYWDSWDYARLSHGNIWEALLSQHNEHRIVWAKTATIIETQILRIPPASTGILQIFASILASIYLLFRICHNTLQRPRTQALAWLSCTLIMLNPWQGQNLNWEFQTPWFFTNTIVLFISFLLSRYASGKIRNSTMLLTFAVIPFVSIFNTGQGLAVSIGACLVCAVISKRLLVAALASTTGALVFYFRILTYATPEHHPIINFDVDFFSSLALGGPWQGMGFLAIILMIFLVASNYSYTHVGTQLAKAHLASIMFPSLFAVLFGIMTTLSRSGFGISYASEGRFVTHTLMIAISLVLLTSAAIESIARFNCKKVNHALHADHLVPIITIISTLLSVPQIFTKQSTLYESSWTTLYRLHKERQIAMSCAALSSILRQQSLSIAVPCEPQLYPDPNFPINYFAGELPVKPMGWHRQIAESNISVSYFNTNAFTYNIEKVAIRSSKIELKGWAFENQNPQQPVFIIAKYGNGASVAYAVSSPRLDVVAAHPPVKERSGFELLIPLRSGSSGLRQLSFYSRNHSEVILSNLTKHVPGMIDAK